MAIEVKVGDRQLRISFDKIKDSRLIRGLNFPNLNMFRVDYAIKADVLEVFIDGARRTHGFAFCSKTESPEMVSTVKGKTLALARALKELELSKAERLAIWTQVFQEFKKNNGWKWRKA